LTNLIRLRIVPVTLQIYFLLNARHSEDTMTSAGSFVEPMPAQQVAQIVERNICIRLAFEYFPYPRRANARNPKVF
jgi:hypothetical protein